MLSAEDAAVIDELIENGRNWSVLYTWEQGLLSAAVMAAGRVRLEDCVISKLAGMACIRLHSRIQ